MSSPDKADLPAKPHDHHRESHIVKADLLRDVVIGMSDGLTVPFALAAGLSGAVSSTNLIIIAGLAEIAAGSIAMGLGGYLAGKTETDHYNSELKREYEEVETVPEMEKQELRTFFSSLGLSSVVQEQAVEEVSKDKEKWVELMMKYELGLEKPDPLRAKKSAFNIGFSYVIGGLIPLSPYFFVSNGIQGLKISTVITLICLFVFGYFKSKLTGVNRWEGAVRVMIIGAIAAGCAFAIARLIQTGHY
ncbi:MAG: VIT1/CCC1 transporter family protein [Bacteroidota bacterium]|nr:VIT1/CCC1 transporter family protein [Bacteroidota bacterium]